MALVERKRQSSPSPSSSTTRQPKYDVFLSFRGEDTCTNFTEDLYVALKQKGIITFRGEEELKKGERIFKRFEAIEESQFAIIILSRNYASSTWCLDELVKIIKCEGETGLKVLPVFYNVSPSIVRKQTEPFEQAFIDHQKHFEDNIEKVETWRDSLKKVADIHGWDLHLQNRYEFEIIQEIVKVIMGKLSSKSSKIDKYLIGIKSMVAKLIPSYLGFENDIYMMGICGMGGLVKTTLARAIYCEYSDHFEGSSFIANVRERSEKGELHKLQQQLLDEILEGRNTKIYNVQAGVIKIKKSGLRSKKVLLVLDDVNHKDQLEKLAGERDWFGSGSWIIITTRDEHVLIDHGVPKIYKSNGLNYDDALKLFCLKAFKNVQPKEGYMQLSKEVVGYASGHPLALVTLGSFLVGRTIEEWQSALDNFKNIKGDIHDILKISYDGLEEMWKEIFLDIACFFRGKRKDRVIQILENCGFDAELGVSVLVERSLLTVDNEGFFGMHDLLLEMGQKIIRFESGGKLGKQSRLWLVEDLLHVLENDMATEAIQAIVIRYKENDFNFEEVLGVLSSKMSNLRLMIIEETDFWYDPGHLGVPNNQRELFVPNHLRHLSWDYCPLKCLSSNYQPKELVQLDLKYSRIEYLWEGVMHSINLKFIDLSHSKSLIRTPDFLGVPKLEVLNLVGCVNLVEIHPSIAQHTGLRHLHLRHCESLIDLPIMSAKMQSLMVLDLFGCFKISSIPKFTGIMKSLSKLSLGKTAIKKLAPSSIKCLTALTVLDLTDCRNFKCFPSNMDSLRSLEKLILFGCSKLKSVQRLPSTIRYIDAQYCYSLEWSPTLVKLSSLSRPLFRWRAYDESGSGMAFTILYRHLQGFLFRKTDHETSNRRKKHGSITTLLVIVYGYKIPSWITHQSAGNSISIELPSNWCNSKWMGFAFCASISTSKWRGFGVRAGVMVNGRDLLVDMPHIHYAYEPFTMWKHCEDSESMPYVGRIWLLYLSSDDWFATVGNDECSQIKVIFYTKDSAIHVCECGVSLVYEQDVDEFSQTNAQRLIESFDGDGDGDGDGEDEL